MRRTSTVLLLAVALVASGSCLAQQAHADVALDVDTVGDTQVDTQVPETMPASRPAPTPAEVEAAPPAEHESAQPTRSAFGKVIAIMISSLQRQSRDSGQPAPPVHTSAAGTPLGIDVGDAFRSSSAAVAAQPDYAVRPSALAGPD